MKKPSAHLSPCNGWSRTARRVASWVLGVVLAFIAQSAGAEPRKAAPNSEPQAKARWLANFLHYVQWPERSLPKPGQHLTVGFLSADSVAGEMNGLVSGKYSVKGRPVAIRRSAKPEDMKGCQVLFMAKPSSAALKAALTMCQGSGVLTVSDMDRFVGAGGMVGIRAEGGQVRFEINNALVRREGLRIAGDLLAMAERLK